jgi:hypothetical protein
VAGAVRKSDALAIARESHTQTLRESGDAAQLMVWPSRTSWSDSGPPQDLDCLLNTILTCRLIFLNRDAMPELLREVRHRGILDITFEVPIIHRKKGNSRAVYNGRVPWFGFAERGVQNVYDTLYRPQMDRLWKPASIISRRRE